MILSVPLELAVPLLLVEDEAAVLPAVPPELAVAPLLLAGGRDGNAGAVLLAEFEIWEIAVLPGFGVPLLPVGGLSSWGAGVALCEGTVEGLEFALFELVDEPENALGILRVRVELCGCVTLLAIAVPRLLAERETGLPSVEGSVAGAVADVVCTP